MADVIKINENTWRIEDGMVRFFLLEGKEKALLVDTGMTAPNAREIAEGITNLPVSLINTHADPDHISGNGAFESFYMHPAEERNLRKHGNTGTILPVSQGMVLDLGDRELEIIELPGHTPGSIAILDLKQRFLISGDAIQDSNIFMFGPERNLPAYLESLEAIVPQMERFDTIYPSHGTFPLAPAVIPALIACAKALLAGEAQGMEVELFGNKVMLYKFSCAGFLCEK